MKKFLTLMLALVLLLTAVTAVAEGEPLALRGGLHWGMPIADAIEFLRTSEGIVLEEVPNDEYYFLGLKYVGSGIQVGDFVCDMALYTDPDYGVFACDYEYPVYADTNKRDIYDDYVNVTNALDSKYGSHDKGYFQYADGYSEDNITTEEAIRQGKCMLTHMWQSYNTIVSFDMRLLDSEDTLTSFSILYAIWNYWDAVPIYITPPEPTPTPNTHGM